MPEKYIMCFVCKKMIRFADAVSDPVNTWDMMEEKEVTYYYCKDCYKKKEEENKD